MRITITDIYPAPPRKMGNIAAPGYKVQFTSSLVRGIAIFVPASSKLEGICGETFEVEVAQEGIEGFAVESAATALKPQITPTSRDGDYEVLGQTTSILPRGDDATKAIITIRVGDALLVIGSDEVGNNYPEEGGLGEVRGKGGIIVG